MAEIYAAVKVTCQGRGRYRQVQKGFYDLDVEEPVDQLFHVGEGDGEDGHDHMDDGDDLIEVKVISLDGEPLILDQPGQLAWEIEDLQRVAGSRQALRGKINFNV